MQSSDLLAAGVDVVTVSKALGHANPHITLTVYAHAIPTQRQGGRRFRASHGPKWKQNGNIGHRTGLRGG